MIIRFHDHGILRGFYDHNQRLISIRRGMSWCSTIEVFIHEFGHWCISCLATNRQQRFDINLSYDILWTKFIYGDLNLILEWYEKEAERCGLEFKQRNL